MVDTQIEYEDTLVSAHVGQRLLDALLRAGIDHRHICGGRGFCTSCRVEVMGQAGNLSAVSSLERERLGCDAGRLRLACQCHIAGPVQVRPARAASSRFSLCDR